MTHARIRTRRSALALAALLALGAWPAEEAQAATCTWNPASGAWNVAASWSCGFVPGNLDMAVIAAGKTVAVTGAQPATNVDNNGTIQISNSASLGLVGSNANAGQIELNSVGNATDLVINGVVSLNGGGTVSMSNSQGNRIIGNGASTFTVGSGQTVQGAGQIGVGGAMTLVNDGTIAATLSQGMVINTTAGVTNNSVLRASGGTLTLQNTAVAQGAGGVLDAAGSAVQLSNASITGGGFTSSGSGAVVTANGTFGNLLSGVTNAGTVNVVNNSGIDLTGTLTNNGTVNLQSVGNATDLRLTGAQSIVGSGVVAMSNTQSNRIFGTGATLTLGSGQTVTGAATIGAGAAGFSLTNQGTVIASSSQGILINAAGGVTNTGTLRADGGALQLQTTVNSGGGSIEALNGSQVQLLNGAVINNANFSASGGGLITTLGGATVTLGGGNVSGPLNLANNSFVNLTGDLTYNGAMTMSSVGNATDLRLDGVRSIDGNATIQMSNTQANRLRAFNASGDALTLGAGVTVQGAGALGNGTALAVTNNGTVIATSSLGLLVETTSGLTNNGVMRADGGTLQFGNVVVDSAGGTIEARNGSQVQLLNGSTINNANFSATGAGSVITTISGATVTLGGGTVSGPLNLANNSFLRLAGDLAYNGTMTMSSVGNATDLRIDGVRSIAGTATIDMSNSTANRFFAANASGDSITLGSGITVRGAGSIAAGSSLGVVNNGTIVADKSQGIVLQTPVAATNNAVMRADGAAFSINQTTLNQGASGTLNAINGGSVVLNTGTQVNGGNFSTASGGQVVVLGGNTAGIAGVTNTGALNIANNGTLVLNGGLTNDGSVSLQSVGNLTELRVSGNRSIGGIGSITTSNSTANRIVALNPGDSLTFGAGQTLQGAASIGGGTQLNLTNNGTMLGTVGPALIFSSTGVVSNNGTVRADAGNVEITGGTNFGQTSGGVLGAINGGVVTLTGNATVSGGTLATADTGQFSTVSGQTATIASLSNTGTVNVVNNSFLRVQGSIDNTGALNLTSAGNNTDLRVVGAATIGGSGAINFASNTLANRVVADAPGATLTLGPAQTLQGAGSLGAGTQLNIVNQGTVAATSGSGLTVATTGTVTNAAGGLMQGTSTGALTLNTSVTNNGTLHANSGTVNANQGFNGTGTVLISGAGVMNVGAPSSTGTLTHNGSAANGLALGVNNLTVNSDYANASSGSGNTFNRRANVTGTGQILAGGDAAQIVTGANVTNGSTANATLTIGNVRVGTTTLDYQIANAGTTGPALRGALQTSVNGANVTDARLSGSGVTADNYNAGGPGGNSGDRSVVFTAASAGVLAPLTGQAVNLRSNFDNIADQKLDIVLGSGAAAYNAAVGSAVTPVVVANQHVGGSNSVTLLITNTAAAGAFSEDLNVSIGALGGTATGSGSVNGRLAGTNNTGAGAITVGVNTTTAGAQGGVVRLDYDTAGAVAGVSNGLGVAGVGLQDVAVSGNVYRLAVADAIAPIDFGNVLAGSAQTRTVTISNVAAADGFSEALNAAFGAVGGADAASFATSGTITGLLAGSSDNTTMTVTLNTGSTGVRTANVQIMLASNGDAIGNGLGITALPSQTISLDGIVTGTVGNLASAGLSPTTVNFGKFREGMVASQTQQLTVSNLTTGPGEGLNASFGASTGTASNNAGTIVALATGASNGSAMTVSLNGLATAGAKSGTQAVDFVSDGTFNSGVPTALPSQTVSLAAEVYRLAQAGVTPTVALAARRVGDAAATGVISIANTAAADGYSEGLAGSVGAAPAGFAVSGPAATGLLAAGTATTRTVSLSTATSGSFAGTVGVALVSNGAGTSGFGDLALAGQNTAVSGKVYAAASGSVVTGSVDFGVVRVGDTVSARNITVQNVAAATALDDTMQASLTTGGAYTGSGPITGLVAGGSGDLAIGLSTATAGIFNATASVDFLSQNADMSDVSAGSGSVALLAQVNNLANADFDLLSGLGMLTQSGSDYVLDFGNITLGSMASALLQLDNDVGGPADVLAGDFAFLDALDFLYGGWTSVSGLAAGDAFGGLTVDFNAVSLGLFTDQIEFSGLGTNASDPDGLAQSRRLLVRANVVDDTGTVPEPGTMALALAALAIGTVLRRRRGRAH
jgi:hypothetical protein